jgi:hypothetical protein
MTQSLKKTRKRVSLEKRKRKRKLDDFSDTNWTTIRLQGMGRK